MSKIYVFGIGGTGSRVFRALTHLLASGVECKEEVVPIIIDPDENNGDLTRTVTLMKKYKFIHDKLNFNTSLNNKFFKTDIMENITNYILPLMNIRDVKFKDYMDLGGMDTANEALMKMLFSDKNLESNMQVGFKGNPNIGSVVLNQFVDSSEFKEFANGFKEGDRIFIVSSIFGGTGASGFPLLLKTLRYNNTLPNFGLLNNSRIGAITVLPYFTVKSDDKSSIESDTFISKTKSALEYYNRNIGGNTSIDQLYYIGDLAQAADAYDNVEGGSEQKNRAHFMELLSALAILDFANSEETGRNKETVYKEFGIQVDDQNIQTVIFENLGQKTNAMLRNPLIQQFFFSNYMLDEKNTDRDSQQWVKDKNYGFDQTFFRSDFMSYLKDIFEDFHTWLLELEYNHISFAPFTWNETNLFKRIKGLAPKKASFFGIGKDGYSLFDQRLDEQHKKLPKGEKPERLLMELFYNTTQNLVSEKFNL